MLKKFGPGAEYHSESTELNLKRTYIKQERQSLLDSSIVHLPKSIEQNDETLFMTSQEKARLRNEALLKSAQKINSDIEKYLKRPDDTEFANIKKNYWDMIEKVLPLWERDLADYEKRKKNEHRNNMQDI